MYSLYMGSRRTFKLGRGVRRARTCTSIKQSFEFTGASSGWCTDQGTDASGFVMLMSENITMSLEILDKNSHCPFVSGLCMRNKIPKSNFGQTYNWEINWFEIAPAFPTGHFILLPVHRLHRKSSYLGMTRSFHPAEDNRRTHNERKYSSSNIDCLWNKRGIKETAPARTIPTSRLNMKPFIGATR